MNLKKVIQGCRDQDPVYQEKLVKHYAPSLLRLCSRYLYDDNLAYDALQECFMNVFKYIGGYKEEGKFDAWIKRIAVNCALGVRKKMSGSINIEDIEYTEEAPTYVPDYAAQFSEQDILKLVDRLPTSAATIFNLYVVEGYSHKEIAELLDIKESSSRSQLTRARVKMVEMIEEKKEAESFRLNQVQIQYQ